MATTLSIQAPATSRSAPLRRSGWLLIAAFLTFIAAIAFNNGPGKEYINESVAAAEAAGTSFNAVPVADQAQLAVRHAAFFVNQRLLSLVPLGLFFAGLQVLVATLRAAKGAVLSRVAWWLGLGMTIGFSAHNGLKFGLLAGPDNLPPLVRNLDVLTNPLTACFGMLGLGAVICAGLAARQARVAPRTGLGAAVISALFVLLGLALAVGSGFVNILPPLAPFVPALILAIGLVRTKPA